ncbi:putative homing endonuclease [Escherichia phage DaisyDussoix]|uniref:Homing endonuclease n=1 Tax=Escherichia phage DaisyDussoix TaxID=2852003 RepID=A0AAE7VQB3_9CAUD|nr:putative homing endonuclease [Escherichia phage DaisyDussoix]
MFIRIPEFPDYAVNENGEVYSFLSYKFLTPGQNTAGYLQVNLMKDGLPINVRVHRLVAYCFGLLPGLESELVVDHINDDKLDPRLSNLQVLTYRANAIKFHNKNWREHPDFLVEIKKLRN